MDNVKQFWASASLRWLCRRTILETEQSPEERPNNYGTDAGSRHGYTLSCRRDPSCYHHPARASCLDRRERTSRDRTRSPDASYVSNNGGGSSNNAGAKNSSTDNIGPLCFSAASACLIVQFI